MSAKSLRRAVCTLVTAASGALATVAWAADSTVLAPPDAAPGDLFGEAVAASGSTVVVGSQWHDHGRDGVQDGAAYVYVRCGGLFLFQGELHGSDAIWSRFGAAVAADGDTIAVGAPEAVGDQFDGGPGAVYVFERARGVWTQTAKLVGAGPWPASGAFGAAVALQGDTLVVGAPATNQDASGAVHVFVRSGGAWTERARFDGTRGSERLGTAVALDGRRFAASSERTQRDWSYNGAVFLYELAGTTWTPAGVVDPPDLLPYDLFGSALALEGDVLAVGAGGSNAVQPDSGAAYVYELIGGQWRRTALLSTPNSVPAESFGQALALRGGRLAVGAYRVGDFDEGAAFLFEMTPEGWAYAGRQCVPVAPGNDFNGWSVALLGDAIVSGAPGRSGTCGAAFVGGLATKLLALDGGAGDEFGTSAAIDGDTAIVGAASDDDQGTDSGSAYVFVREGDFWVQQAKLVASDGAAGRNFGRAVSLSGDTALVCGGGAGYVFVRADGAWTQQGKLTTASAASSVSVSGETALLGAQQVPSGNGAAYVFVRQNGAWTQEATLTASDGERADAFGAAVSVQGDTAVVGAKTDADQGAGAGSAYVFVRASGVWTQQAKLLASDGNGLALFGMAVALSGDTALVGTGMRNAAYVFVRSGTAWSQQAKFAGAAGETWFGTDVGLDGDVAVVGAPYGAGAAHVYRRTGGAWREQTRLDAPDAAPEDSFGSAVAVSGANVLVGSVHDDDRGLDSGSAWVLPVGVPAAPTAWRQAALLAASDAEQGDYLGRAVAIDGDIAVVGAYFDDDQGHDAGAAYVFVRTGGAWVQEAKLHASDGVDFSYFGRSVSVSGDTVLVGAFSWHQGAFPMAIPYGAAYVFVRAGGAWTQQAKLMTPTQRAGEEFGWSVAVAGDVALVGVPFRYGGAVEVFERSGTSWSYTSILTPSEGAADDQFGFALGLDRDTAVVGAWRNDAAAPDAGAAYVFVRSAQGWAQQAKLTASDATQGASLGWSVAVSGDLALLGGGGDGSNGTTDGCAYVFSRSGTAWTQAARLTPAGRAAGDGYGSGVALDGVTAIVGAYADGADRGAAYVFRPLPGGWGETARLVADDGQPGDQFGWSVAVSGTTALVGACRDTTTALQAGSAYVFDGYAGQRPAASLTLPAQWTVGLPLAAQAAVAGGVGPYQWRVVSGALPDGLSLGLHSGLVSGAPTVAGASAFSAECADATGDRSVLDIAMTVNPALEIAPFPFTVAFAGRPCRTLLTCDGGTGGVTWSLDSGGSGLTIDPASGLVTGTPPAPGAYVLSIGASDTLGAAAPVVRPAVRVFDPLAVPGGRTRVGLSSACGTFERYLELLGGTTVDVTASAPRRSAAPGLFLLDATGTPIDLGGALRTRRSVAQIRRFVVPATSRYVLRVVPAPDEPAVAVTLQVKLTAPRGFVRTLALADGQTTSVVVPTLPGARVAVVVTAGRRQVVSPHVVSVRDATGADLAVAPHETARRAAFSAVHAAGGDLVVALGTRDGSSGTVHVRVAVAEPRGYDFTLPDAPAGD